MENDKIKAPTESEMWETWKAFAGIDDDEEEDMYDTVRYKIWADGARWMRDQILNPICDHKDKHGSNLIYIGSHKKKCLDCGYIATSINPDGTVYDT